MVTISESAQEYLGQLLKKQDVDGMAVRVFVTQPGTRNAETCLAYCKPEEIIETDEKVPLKHFMLYLDTPSLPYLEEAVVDFNTERFGGQLTIKAPNAKAPRVGADAPLADRINYILYSEINPGLASHGGEVSLVEITEDKVAVLKFGGGCQGCAAVDITLKNGVEKTLKAQVPELSAVRDVTDHSETKNAYYK